jgi:hypothetical protein
MTHTVNAWLCTTVKNNISLFLCCMHSMSSLQYPAQICEPGKGKGVWGDNGLLLC